jgi:hypothetical protein
MPSTRRARLQYGNQEGRQAYAAIGSSITHGSFDAEYYLLRNPACILGQEWTGIDEETDYPVQMARDMLFELVGGEPGAQLREQFVSGKCA